MNKKIVITGICFILTSIILGAFGAHSLEKLVAADKLASYETGVRYQIYEGMALLVLGLNADKFNFSLKAITILLITGTLFFSISIYLLSIQEVVNMSFKFLGPVTPIGGGMMIIGWSILLINVIRSKS